MYRNLEARRRRRLSICQMMAMLLTGEGQTGNITGGELRDHCEENARGGGGVEGGLHQVDDTAKQRKNSNLKQFEK